MTEPNPRWRVLGKRTEGSPWQFVGEVHAPDADLALLLAKESFFRHREGVRLAVERRETGGAPAPEAGGPRVQWREFEPADLLEPATDKSYRLQTGYAGLGRRRRAVVERVRAEGRHVTRPRPPDRRTAAEGTDG